MSIREPSVSSKVNLASTVSTKPHFKSSKPFLEGLNRLQKPKTHNPFDIFKPQTPVEVTRQKLQNQAKDHAGFLKKEQTATRALWTSLHGGTELEKNNRAALKSLSEIEQKLADKRISLQEAKAQASSLLSASYRKAYDARQKEIEANDNTRKIEAAVIDTAATVAIAVTAMRGKPQGIKAGAKLLATLGAHAPSVLKSAALGWGIRELGQTGLGVMDRTKGTDRDNESYYSTGITGPTSQLSDRAKAYNNVALALFDKINGKNVSQSRFNAAVYATWTNATRSLWEAAGLKVAGAVAPQTWIPKGTASAQMFANGIGSVAAYGTSNLVQTIGTLGTNLLWSGVTGNLGASYYSSSYKFVDRLIETLEGIPTAFFGGLIPGPAKGLRILQPFIVDTGTNIASTFIQKSLLGAGKLTSTDWTLAAINGIGGGAQSRLIHAKMIEGPDYRPHSQNAKIWAEAWRHHYKLTDSQISRAHYLAISGVDHVTAAQTAKVIKKNDTIYLELIAASSRNSGEPIHLPSLAALQNEYGTSVLDYIVKRNNRGISLKYLIQEVNILNKYISDHIPDQFKHIPYKLSYGNLPSPEKAAEYLIRSSRYIEDLNWPLAVKKSIDVESLTKHALNYFIHNPNSRDPWNESIKSISNTYDIYKTKGFITKDGDFSDYHAKSMFDSLMRGELPPNIMNLYNQALTHIKNTKDLDNLRMILDSGIDAIPRRLARIASNNLMSYLTVLKGNISEAHNLYPLFKGLDRQSLDAFADADRSVLLSIRDYKAAGISNDEINAWLKNPLSREAFYLGFKKVEHLRALNEFTSHIQKAVDAPVEILKPSLDTLFNEGINIQQFSHRLLMRSKLLEPIQSSAQDTLNSLRSQIERVKINLTSSSFVESKLQERSSSPEYSNALDQYIGENGGGRVIVTSSTNDFSTSKISLVNSTKPDNDISSTNYNIHFGLDIIDPKISVAAGKLSGLGFQSGEYYYKVPGSESWTLHPKNKSMESNVLPSGTKLFFDYGVNGWLRLQLP